MAAELDREQEEKKEAEASVAAFRRQLNQLKEKCASLDVEIEQHRAAAANLLRERKREQAILGTHAARAHPELAACEAALKCTVEGIGDDRILVRFTHVDPADVQREFSLVVDASARIYKGPPPFDTLPCELDLTLRQCRPRRRSSPRCPSSSTN